MDGPLRPSDSVIEVWGVDPASLRRRQYGCVARAAAAFMLGRYAGMNQRDIGVFLGMGTGSAVCRQFGRLRERLRDDAELREKIDRIASAVKAKAGQPAPGAVAVNGRS